MIQKTTLQTYKDIRGNLMWTSPKLLDFNYKYLTMGTVKPNCSRGGHYHNRISEKLLCLHGSLVFQLDNESTVIGPGDIVDIPTGKTHTITNVGIMTAVFIEFKDEEYDESDPDTYKQDTTDK